MSGSCDLLVLAADKCIEAALSGILGRSEVLGIRPVEWKTFVHPERDPGCYRRSPEFLASMLRSCSRALVVFDLHGCGREENGPDEIEREVEERLRAHGWEDRAAAICLDPEVECWVWGDIRQVEAILGWRPGAPRLRSWLVDKGLWRLGASKPSWPKKAFEEALRHVRKPRSSSLYLELAQRVDIERCSDLRFGRLRQLLSDWFPKECGS